MILIDRLLPGRRPLGGGHMVSSVSVEELHAFADRIGLPRSRFRGTRRGHPHYDLRINLRGRALMYGAREVDTRTLVRRMARP